MKRRTFVKETLLTLAGAALGAAKSSGVQLTVAPRGNVGRMRLTVHWHEHLGKINRNAYGHFAEHLGGCIYDGIWVGTDSKVANIDGLRKASIDALKRIQAPVIRWPGGCFADAYDWREGIGPRDQRPQTWNLWWKREESNAFGTHEFLQFCQLSGAQPYFCLNVGSGNPREAMEWIEYVNGKENTTLARLRAAHGHPEPYDVRYWSIGNENWGCGGHFDPDDYAHTYDRFVSYLEPLSVYSPLEFIACGFTNEWNQKFLETRKKRNNGRLPHMQHLSIHWYTQKGKSVDFTDAEYYGLLNGVAPGLEKNIRDTIAILDFFNTEVSPIGVAVDEWGVWHPDIEGSRDTALLQRSTLRDAILAAACLNVFNQFGSRVTMGNIAQTFNVLQCLAFTRGPEFVLTPTYHVFDLFQPHMDAMALRTVVDGPSLPLGAEKGPSVPCLSASASLKGAEKRLCLTLVNQHLTDTMELEISLVGLDSAGIRRATLRELTSKDVRDENSFEKPNGVSPPTERAIAWKGPKFVHVIPPHTIQAMVVELN